MRTRPHTRPLPPEGAGVVWARGGTQGSRMLVDQQMSVNIAIATGAILLMFEDYKFVKLVKIECLTPGIDSL